MDIHSYPASLGWDLPGPVLDLAIGRCLQRADLAMSFSRELGAYLSTISLDP